MRYAIHISQVEVNGERVRPVGRLLFHSKTSSLTAASRKACNIASHNLIDRHPGGYSMLCHGNFPGRVLN